MDDRLSPETEAELVDAIRWALSERSPLEITGSGTKRELGRVMQTRATLDMSGFNGIAVYEPEELILEAGAATPMSLIESALQDRNQQLAFEPPDYTRLLDASHAGTLAGTLCCGLSGPRRLKAGAVRDHVLGVAGVSGRGEAFKAGARVVKNVTGYDLPKLMAGSWGTLAALTSITMKVLPRAETEETVAVLGEAAATAIETMSESMQSSCEVSGAAHVPRGISAWVGFAGAATLLRLEGIAPSVAYRRERLFQLLRQKGEIEVLQKSDSQKVWRAIRDVHPLCAEPERSVWRVSVRPSVGAGILEAVPDAAGYLDWAGGLVWLAVPDLPDAGAAALRTRVSEGHATLMRASAALRAAVDVFEPLPPALAELTARVKLAFDPQGLLNPGRMYLGV